MFTCPDCGRKNEVPPLPPPEPPPIDVMAGHDPNDMPLGEVPQRAAPSIASMNLLAVDAEEPQADASLAKPQTRSRGMRVVRYRWPFMRGVFNFPVYPTQALRLAILAVGLAVEMNLVAIAISALQKAQPGAGLGGLGVWLASLGSTLMAGLWGIIFGAYACAYALQIVVQTASGADREIQAQPVAWIEWLLDAAVVIVAATVSMTLGLPLLWLMQQFVLPGHWAMMASLFIFFPPVLLSILEANSAFTFFSRPIWSSVWVARPAWGKFYLASALLLSTLVAGAWLSFQLPDLWGSIVASVLIAAGIMIYARLLGRVTWFIPQTRLSEDDDEQDEEEDDDDADEEAIPGRSPGLMTGD
jgi:hypothetical protein